MPNLIKQSKNYTIFASKILSSGSRLAQQFPLKVIGVNLSGRMTAVPAEGYRRQFKRWYDYFCLFFGDPLSNTSHALSSLGVEKIGKNNHTIV